MKFFNRIFRKNWITCPRCLGKGHVDQQDITRLKMEIFWKSGKCAYCKGNGIVPPEGPQRVSPDLAYLSLDLPFEERNRLIRGDKAALERAAEFNMFFLDMVASIEQLYFSENRLPEDIAHQLFVLSDKQQYTAAEKQEMVRYIEKIVSLKKRN